MKVFQYFCILFIFLLTFVNCDDDVPLEDPIERPKASEKEESAGNKDVPTTTSPGQETEEENQYKLGSLCNYCSYCKFCKLCDKDCPCQTSKTKPNCHLCKYCKYCFLCSTCDVACTPGGILDTISSAIYSSLPTFTKKEQEDVDKDIEKAKDWIKEYL